MGKGILILLAASVVGGSMMLYQAQRTSRATEEVQTEQQRRVLAREIARSAYNAAYARARKLEANGKTREEIVAELATHNEGTYQGGMYYYEAAMVYGSSYEITAKGTYGEFTYEINGRQTYEVPTVPTYCMGAGCEFMTAFIESSAGYCSAVYVQLFVPKDTYPPRDDDDDRPEGRLVGDYYVLEPELVFTPGHNRDHVGATYERTLYPGTKVNFILAVDKNCSLQGEEVPFDPSKYDHLRYAFEDAGDDLSQLVETNWVMYQQHAEEEGTWRIAFEDRPDTFGSITFTDAKLLDVKKNAYPVNGNDSDAQWNGETYGGDGWELQHDGSGYGDLEDYGKVPDFSDQVFSVTFKRRNEGGEDD